MIHPSLLLGLQLVAYFSGYRSENAFLHYWKEHVGLPDPPQWLVAKASPLNVYQMTTFIKLLEENELASHLFSFCKLADVVCSSNALVKKTTNDTAMPPVAQWNWGKLKYDSPNEKPLLVASQGGLPYFRKSMVKQGSFISIPDLRDPISYRSFLPRLLASKFPFSIARIRELKSLLDVRDNSSMNEYIQDTLETCEKSHSPGEERTCLTSAEDLIDFVIDKLGHHISIWSTENIKGSYENATIGDVKLIYGNLSEPPILCHSLPFPFQIYYCHIIRIVKLYAVDIHAQEGVNHAIMACHYDTSTWNSNHIAFNLLGFGPGQIEVCHWIVENGVVWTNV